VGLGNKSNGGRIKRLWRGRRRKRWYAAIAAEPVPLPPPPAPLGFGPICFEPYEQPAADGGSFGPIDAEPHEQPAADGGGFGPIDVELFDEVPPGTFGPIDTEPHEQPAADGGGFGPIDAEPHEAPAADGGGFGPVDPFSLYVTSTAAFSEPARQLVSGRGYTSSAQFTIRQLEQTSALNLMTIGGSYQIASLPTADGDTLFTQVELECTAGVGVTVDAVVTVTDQDGNIMIPATTLTNFRLTGDVFSLVAVGSTRVLQQNILTGAVLLLIVNTPATGTTLTATARVIGFPVT